MGDGTDESKPEAVRNRISDGAVVIGPVVQAGTFTGQVHHHHGDQRQPLDLLALRLWTDRVAADYRAMVERTGDQSGTAHVRQVDLVRAALDDDGHGDGHGDGRRADAIRRLVVAGIVGYLARPGPPPDRPVSEQILLDLIVFALWPVVTARTLPPGWQGELARITSPRLAALVERARGEREPAAEAFARVVANRSFSSAMVTLFDDLADPRRGGAVLTAMALVGHLTAPPTRRGEGWKVVVWALAIAGGAALADNLADRGSPAARIVRELTVAPTADAVDPVDVAELLGWLIG